MSKALIYKICLFGDINVGKTSLTQAGIQKNEVKPPVCIDIAIKNLTINIGLTVFFLILSSIVNVS